MKNLTGAILAAALALGLGGAGCAPAFATTLSPVGRWQSDTGESRYQLSMCGDGTQLCARVIWLRSDIEATPARKYLGTYMLEDARRVGPHKWHGIVHFMGYRLAGDVTVVNPSTIALRGCAFAIFCKTFHLKRLAAN